MTRYEKIVLYWVQRGASPERIKEALRKDPEYRRISLATIAKTHARISLGISTAKSLSTSSPNRTVGEVFYSHQGISKNAYSISYKVNVSGISEGRQPGRKTRTFHFSVDVGEDTTIKQLREIIRQDLANYISQYYSLRKENYRLVSISYSNMISI